MARPKKNASGQTLDPTTNKYRVGRPTIVTPEVIKKLEEAYAMDCTDGEACLAANISEVTLYNYQNENPEFVNRKRQLKNNPYLIARTTLMTGLKGNPDLALKYMERKKKDEFSLKTETEHSGTINNRQVYMPEEDKKKDE